LGQDVASWGGSTQGDSILCRVGPCCWGQFEKDQTPTTALIAQITAVEAYSPRAAK
jgi:hypothetical protein